MMGRELKHIGDPTMLLMEEASELIKAASKGARFGWDNVYPEGAPTNLEKLKMEMSHVIEAYEELIKIIEKQNEKPVPPKGRLFSNKTGKLTRVVKDD